MDTGTAAQKDEGDPETRDGFLGVEAIQELLAQQTRALSALIASQSEQLQQRLAREAKAARTREEVILELRTGHETYRQKLLSAGLATGEMTDTGGTPDESSAQQEAKSTPLAGAASPSPLPLVGAVQQQPVRIGAVIYQDCGVCDLPGSIFQASSNSKDHDRPPPKSLNLEEMQAVVPQEEQVILHYNKNSIRTSASSASDYEEHYDKAKSGRQADSHHSAHQRKAGHSLKQALLGKKENESHAKVFPDAAAMKEKLKQAILKKEYNVQDYYHTTGLAQYIAKSWIFDNATLVVIGLNALWIAIDTDYNKKSVLIEADVPFIIAENLFCAYFFFEWLMRFCAFKRKRSGLKDAWFMFDSLLVSVMVLETWVMSCFLLLTGWTELSKFGDSAILRILRLVRMSRMFRMVRLLRAMPELMVMIKAMIIALRSVFFALSLLTCVIYVFGIAFSQMLDGTAIGQESFSSVLWSMNTLLLDGTLPDQASIVMAVFDEGIAYYMGMLCYIFLASLTVMNMLVGILCEVVSAVSAYEKEDMLIRFVKNELQEMISSNGFDNDGSGYISKEEFALMLNSPSAMKVIQDVGVDVVGLVDFVDFLFASGDEISFGDFMETLLSLRGSNVATVKDIIDLRKLVSNQMLCIKELQATHQKSCGGNEQSGFPDHKIRTLPELAHTEPKSLTVPENPTNTSAAAVSEVLS